MGGLPLKHWKRLYTVTVSSLLHKDVLRATQTLSFANDRGVAGTPPACDIGYLTGRETVQSTSLLRSLLCACRINRREQRHPPCPVSPRRSSTNPCATQNFALSKMARTLGALKQHLSGPKTIMGQNGFTDTENGSEQGVCYVPSGDTPSERVNAPSHS